MNKLFTKIGTAMVGIAMAIGVGVAVGRDQAREVKATNETWALTSDSFTKVTSSSDLSSGDYVIIVASSDSYNKAIGSQGSNLRNAAAITKDGNDAVADADDTVAVFEIGTQTISGDDYITFFDGEGYLACNSYVSGKTKKAQLTTLASLETTYGQTAWSIDFTNNIIQALSGQDGDTTRITLAYNYNNGSDRFSCYTDTSSSTVVLYKKNAVPTPSNYTLKYNANGGSGSIDDQEYEPNEQVTVANNVFTSPDSFHEFKEFNTKANGSGTGYAEGAKFNISSNTTLYAIWQPKTINNLVSGFYTANLGYSKPIANELSLKNSSSTQVGVVSITSNVEYNDSKSEYGLAKTDGILVFKNHTNALLTKAIVNVFQYDNIDVYLGSNPDPIHSGDGGQKSTSTSEPYAIEINLDSPSGDDLKIQGNGGSGTFKQWIFSVELYYQVAYTSSTFAALIMSETQTRCNAYEDGVSDYAEYKAAFATVWTNLAKAYATMSTEDKNLFVNATYTREGSTVTATGTTTQAIADAVARYDFLTVKYGLAGFIAGRTPVANVATTGFGSVSTQSSSTLIIVIASVIGLTTIIGVSFMMKKKKEQ